MAYATAQDLRNRYPESDLRQLTSEHGDVVDDDALERALADASDEIDGYLIGRYALPLAQVPRVLVRYACEIGYYLLMKGRPQETVADAKARYDQAMKYFMRVSQGEVQLSLSDTEAPAAQTDGPTVVTSTRVFTREAMRGL